MAIAFDNITNTGFKNGTANTNNSHSVAGSDRLGIVAVYSAVDNVTSVTWDSVSCTFIDKLLMTGAAAGQYIHLYYIVAPPTGITQIQVNSSSALGGYFSIVSYTGVNASGQPDASNKGGNSSATSITTSVTTTADNCWLIGFAYTGSTMSAGTGTTLRGGSVGGIIEVIDSNSDTTPAGSDSLIVTHTSNFNGMIIASFAPTGGGGGVIKPQFTGFSHL
jgi:hypothetical protein